MSSSHCCRSERKVSRLKNSRSHALGFVVLIGVVSFFGDFTYEGSRSILGPFLAVLGASGTVVGLVAGFGECLGYGLRLVSGRLADRTMRFWPLIFLGYGIQMVAVPALALAGSWPAAAALLILERIGKALRTPPRDVLLSHAGSRLGGYGWAFGLHQALDQAGALVGPLVVALVLARQGRYQTAFAVLLAPALVTLVLVGLASFLYPKPEDMEAKKAGDGGKSMAPVFWVYMGGAAFVGAGFADYSLIAFHFQKTATVEGSWVPVFYAVAMASAGIAAPLFGRLFDQKGLGILIPLTLVGTLFAPFVFLGGFGWALAGAVVWGLSTGVHESIIPAAVAPMVNAKKRATAFGLFMAVYGISWFLGSSLIGMMYDLSPKSAMWTCVILELFSLPFLIWALRMSRGKQKGRTK